MTVLKYSKVNDTFATVGTTSAQVLGVNNDRKRLTITNDSDENIYLGFGNNAYVGSGSCIVPNATLNLPDHNYIWAEVVNAICASGSKNLSISEGS